MTALPYAPTILTVIDADVASYNPTRLQFSYRPSHVNTYSSGDTLYLWIEGNGTADGSTHTLDWVLTAPNSNSYNATSWTGQQQYGWLVWNYAVSSLKAAGGAGTWHFIVKKDGVQVFDRTFKVQ